MVTLFASKILFVQNLNKCKQENIKKKNRESMVRNALGIRENLHLDLVCLNMRYSSNMGKINSKNENIAPISCSIHEYGIRTKTLLYSCLFGNQIQLCEGWR